MPYYPYRDNRVSYTYGYGYGSPAAVPADTRVIRDGGRVERGYGSFGDGAMIGGAMGDPSQQAAGAAAGAVGGGFSIGGGIAIGLSVWLLTKMLDHLIFKGERGDPFESTEGE